MSKFTCVRITLILILFITLIGTPSQPSSASVIQRSQTNVSSSQMNISQVDDLLADVVYTGSNGINTKQFRAHSPSSEPSLLTTCSLPAPVLISPVSGILSNTLVPKFQWYSTGTDVYFFQVSTASDFSNMAINTYWWVLPGTIISVQDNINLLPGTTYYWRVASICSDDTSGVFSSVATFQTVNFTGPFLNPPILIFPMDSAILSDMEVTFSWGNMTEAEAWQLRIYNSLSDAQNDYYWSALWSQSWSTSTNYTFDTAGTYYWRMLVRDGTAWGSLSSIRSFTINPSNHTVCLPLVMKNYNPSPITADITPPQTTGIDGKTIFHLPQADVEVTVVDEEYGAQLRDIQLQVVSEGSKALLLMLDPEGNYYPQIQEISLADSSNTGDKQIITGQIVPIVIITIVAVIAIEGYSIYEFLSDPPYIESYGLGWVETCWTPEQLVNAIDVALVPGGFMKLTTITAAKALGILLEEGGQAVGLDIVSATMNAMWCENQWPSPFRVKYSTAQLLLPLFNVTDNFPLQGCNTQISTCPPQSGHIYGTVTDAVTGLPLDLVEIIFPYRPSIFEATNSSGYYSTYRAPAGYSTVQASLPGYASEAKVVYVADGGEAELNFSLSPITQVNEIRAVLTWGASPSDLDSHLWLPDSNPYHIYYQNKGNISSFPWANLDVDDVTSYGPETLTIRIDKVDGRYTLAVYQFSSSGSIATSDATVTVFRGSNTLKTFKVTDATGSGRWWYLADFDPYQAINGVWVVEFFDVNQLSNISPR